MRKNAVFFLILVCTLAFPAAAHAQFQKQGIFGCNVNGAYSNIGSLVAVGGVYVPVNDAAVTLNTGYLVYKECVLRGVVNRMREAETASIGKLTIINYTVGRGGKPQFSQNLRAEDLSEKDRVYALALTNDTLSTVNDSYRSQVEKAVARGYLDATRRKSKELECAYTDVDNSMKGSPNSVWEALTAMTNPMCTPLFAAVRSRELLERDADSAVADARLKLGWGQGTYDIQRVDENGDVITLTPASVVRDNVVQILQSGYRQLENANDIDQMVGALFAGMSSQASGDVRGLIGLTQSSGGKPSYLDQVVSEAQAGLRQSVGNLALGILLAAKQIESKYNSIMREVADTLTQTIQTLRDKENQCWGLIIAKVCTAPPGTNNECTAPGGDKLKVATSTQFSQAIISAQIAPLAETTLTNINNSNKALSLVDQLIAGVSNTSDPAAQQLALRQLDSLVATRQLHTQNDLTQAEQSKSAVLTSMSNILQSTITAWADSTDPNVGWCNVNNAAVIEKWTKAWKI